MIGSLSINPNSSIKAVYTSSVFSHSHLKIVMKYFIALMAFVALANAEPTCDQWYGSCAYLVNQQGFSTGFLNRVSQQGYEVFKGFIEGFTFGFPTGFSEGFPAGSPTG